MEIRQNHYKPSLQPTFQFQISPNDNLPHALFNAHVLSWKPKFVYRCFFSNKTLIFHLTFAKKMSSGLEVERKRSESSESDDGSEYTIGNFFFNKPN